MIDAVCVPCQFCEAFHIDSQAKRDQAAGLRALLRSAWRIKE